MSVSRTDQVSTGPAVTRSAPDEGSALRRAGVPVPAFVGRSQYVGLAGLVALWFLSRYYSQYSQVGALTIVYAVTGVGLVLLFGAAGQLTLGHSLFLGVGAFLSAYLSSEGGFGLEVQIPVVFFVCLLLGLVMGLPSLRVNELYLALATFAIAFVGSEVLIEWRGFTGGGSGTPSGDLTLFGSHLEGGVLLVQLGLVVLGVTFWLVGNLLAGRTGRALNALRTSESAARSAGLNVAWLKIWAFGVSGAIAGVAGILYIQSVRFASPAQFSVDFSIVLVLALLIGGKERLLGAVLGAAFVHWLPETFRGLQEWKGLLYGTFLIVLTIYSPGGLAGVVRSGWVRGRRLARSPSSEAGAPDRRPLGPIVLAPSNGGRRTGHLVVEGMTVAFGGVHAVQDVSFSLEPGAVTGLIGSNGAGKSTCFNGLTGHVRARGTFVLDGVALSGLAAHRRAREGLGRTFQNLNLHGDQRVIDHALVGLDRQFSYGRVAEALRTPKVLRQERRAYGRAAELLDQMGLLEHWNERVDDLPYGLQKRVDVVRALAADPSILLLDEPAAGLPTEEARDRMDQVLAYAGHVGAGVLVIEHNIELVAGICSEVLVMDAGRIIATGPPASVMADARVIAAYLGNER